MLNSEEGYRNGEMYRCHAFVCGVTCVMRTDRDPPPTTTFTRIYQQRPPDCRYAVVGQWDLSRGADRFLVWDLFEVKMSFAANGHLPMKPIVPKPRLVHDDLDAAIMATVMLYNK